MCVLAFSIVYSHFYYCSAYYFGLIFRKILWKWYVRAKNKTIIFERWGDRLVPVKIKRKINHTPKCVRWLNFNHLVIYCVVLLFPFFWLHINNITKGPSWWRLLPPIMDGFIDLWLKEEDLTNRTLWFTILDIDFHPKKTNSVASLL